MEDALQELMDFVDADREQDRTRDHNRADAARSGRLGPEWRRVQERIDRGETAVEAVFDGTDATADAERLRAHAATRVRVTAAELREDAAADPDAPDPLGEAAQILDELHRRLDTLGSRPTA